MAKKWQKNVLSNGGKRRRKARMNNLYRRRAFERPASSIPLTIFAAAALRYVGGTAILGRTISMPPPQNLRVDLVRVVVFAFVFVSAGTLRRWSPGLDARR